MMSSLRHDDVIITVEILDFYEIYLKSLETFLTVKNDNLMIQIEKKLIFNTNNRILYNSSCS